MKTHHIPLLLTLLFAPLAALHAADAPFLKKDTAQTRRHAALGRRVVMYSATELSHPTAAPV